MLVVLIARCAGVVQKPVVRIARYGQRGCVLGVVQIEASRAGRGCVLGVMLTERPSCQRGTGMVWSAHVGSNPSELDRSAEHAHAVDAAARPQDRRFFEGQNQLERDPDLVVAAQLMGRPLGGNRLPSTNPKTMVWNVLPHQCVLN